MVYRQLEQLVRFIIAAAQRSRIKHSVRQPAPVPAQQYFSLTPLQPPAPASPTVFFSHTIPAPASNSSLPNTVKEMNMYLNRGITKSRDITLGLKI